jgi:hypothetical protein
MAWLQFATRVGTLHARRSAGWRVQHRGRGRPHPAHPCWLPTHILPVPAPQVLHFCAVVAPNQDAAFMLSIIWTTIQMLLSGFYMNFSEVQTPGGA